MKLFWTVLAAALAADGGTKLMAARLLEGRTLRLGWLLELRLTYNTGMAFGMFSGNWLANVLLPLTVIFCGWRLMRRYQTTPFTCTACGLIVGGFAGNFLQRLLQGAVLDMMYFPWLPWFVCNIADVCICFGVALLAISLLLRPQDWEEKEAAKDAHH